MCQLKVLFGALLCYLCLVALCVGQECACKNRAIVRGALIGHKDPAEVQQFRDFRQGFLEAAKGLRVEVVDMMPTAFELGTIFQEDVNEAVRFKLREVLDASQPFSFVVTTVPSLSAISKELGLLKQAGITVVSIGPGFLELSEANPFTDNVTLVHLGINEGEAGEEAGIIMGRAGNSALCIKDASVGDSVDDERCAGFEQGFKQTCSSENNCNVTELSVDGKNVNDARNDILNSLTLNPSINTVIVPKGRIAELAVALLGPDELNRNLPQVASFVIDQDVEGLLNENKLLFAVESQDYIASFMATVFANYHVTTGQAVANRQLKTGPKFVLTNRPANNLKISDVVLELIVHGRGIDGFWLDFKKGIIEAARDIGLVYLDCEAANDCGGEPGSVSYRSPGNEFDLASMANLIVEGTSSDPDGMIISIPNVNALQTAISLSVDELNIPTVSVNAGGEDAPGLGMLEHYGQEEVEAGRAAGDKFGLAGVTLALCMNQEQGNSALDQRCQGFTETLSTYGATVLTVDMIFGNKPALQSTIENAASSIGKTVSDIDGYMLLGPSSVAPLQEVLIDLGVAGVATIGSFDVLEETILALESEELLFTIQQQQQMQAYLPTITMTLHALTGQIMTEEWVLTGPALITKQEVEALKCQAELSCSSQEEIEGIVNRTSSCPRPSWAADGWCDPINNIAECDYDGGDCCIETCVDGIFSCDSDRFNSGLNVLSCENVALASGLSRFCSREENSGDDLCLNNNDAFLDESMKALLTAISCIILGAETFLFLCIANFRNNRVLFFSSPKLLLLSIFGTMLIGIHAIASTQAMSSSICAVRMIGFHVGFTCIFSALLVKLYRLLKVFGTRALTITVGKVSNQFMVGVLFSFVAVDILAIASVLILDPMAVSPENPNECISATADAVNIFLLCYNFTVLGLCALLLRKIDMTVPTKFVVFQRDVLATSRAIYHSLGMGIILSVMFVVLQPTMKTSDQILFQAYSGLYISVSTLILIVIFSVMFQALTEAMLSNKSLNPFAGANTNTQSTITLNSQQSKGNHSTSEKDESVAKSQGTKLEEALMEAMEEYQRAENWLRNKRDQVEAAKQQSNEKFERVQQLRADFLYQQAQVKKRKKSKQASYIPPKEFPDI